MTPIEFRQWWADYELHFPGTAEWVDKQQARAPRLLELWAAALEPVSLADCLEVTARQFRGTAERAKAYEREETVAFVLRAVKEIRTERLDAEERRQRRRETAAYSGRQASPFPAGMLFVEYQKARRPVGHTLGGLGMSEFEAQRHIEELLQQHLDRVQATI